MAKVCPKCGGREFIVTAHVTEEWIVDGDGNFIDLYEGYGLVEALHQPDDIDIWQ